MWLWEGSALPVSVRQRQQQIPLDGVQATTEHSFAQVKWTSGGCGGGQVQGKGGAGGRGTFHQQQQTPRDSICTHRRSIPVRHICKLLIAHAKYFWGTLTQKKKHAQNRRKLVAAAAGSDSKDHSQDTGVICPIFGFAPNKVDFFTRLRH
jgi:hypothetical protein